MNENQKLVYMVKRIKWNEPITSDDFYETITFKTIFSTIEKAIKFVECTAKMEKYFEKMKWEDKVFTDRHSFSEDDTEAIYTAYNIYQVKVV